MNEILKGIAAKVILVDFHAEATSEKVAMGWHLDGRVTAVLGTHTHVPTADERVLPGGTAYQTDVGMSGPYDSVIGVERDLVLNKFLTGMPGKFEAAKDNPKMCAALDHLRPIHRTRQRHPAHHAGRIKPYCPKLPGLRVELGGPRRGPAPSRRRGRGFRIQFCACVLWPTGRSLALSCASGGMA